MPSSASPPRLPGRTWWPWILVAAALAAAALALCNGPGEPAPAPPLPPPATFVPAPGGTDSPVAINFPVPASLPVPAGFDQTRDGAIAAAVAYVTSGQALLDMDPGGAEQAVRAMLAAAHAEDQVEDLRVRLAATHRALAGGTGPLRYYQAVLAVRVDAFLPSDARVAVWHVSALAKVGAAPPQAGWAISVVDLVWESGDWKLAQETVVPGPAPMLDRSAPTAGALEFEAALTGFTPWRQR